LYVLHGDETLLQQEALIALRQTANKQGFSERERHDIDRGHDWAMALPIAMPCRYFLIKN
jgi:DNA polymerase-3 subunit delta